MMCEVDLMKDLMDFNVCYGSSHEIFNRPLIKIYIKMIAKLQILN